MENKCTVKKTRTGVKKILRERFTAPTHATTHTRLAASSKFKTTFASRTSYSQQSKSRL